MKKSRGGVDHDVVGIGAEIGRGGAGGRLRRASTEYGVEKEFGSWGPRARRKSGS